VVCEKPSEICERVSDLLSRLGLPRQKGETNIYGGEGIRNLYIEFVTKENLEQSIRGVRPARVLLEGSSQDYTKDLIDLTIPALIAGEQSESDLRILIDQLKLPHDASWIKETEPPYNKLFFSDIRV
jgi:hypothetical protein